MDLDLRGKRAFVSGSSSGIGKAIAQELAREGCDVIVHGRDRARTEETAREVEALGVRSLVTLGDLSDMVACDRIAAEALAAFGTVDILVNNCGAVLQMHNPAWDQVPPEDWALSFRVNFIAGLRMSQLFVPGMKAQGWGRIINISSAGGTHIKGYMPDYCAPKAAVNNFTGNLSKALGPEGITVNAVIPGTVLTPAVDRWLEELNGQLGWGNDPAEYERLCTAQVTPQSVPRLGRPRDIAAAVAFLASPLSGYTNGASIRVDGGSALFF